MSKKKLNIALYGGSFDPPHKGHEQVVEKALQKLNIDKLFIIPAWQNPFKKSFFAPPKLRLKWLKDLWGGDAKISICTYEIENSRPTSSYESLMHLLQKYPLGKIYLIIGADNLKDLPKWHRYDELKKRVEFVVASRKGYEMSEDFLQLDADIDISSSSLRKSFQKEFINESIKDEVEGFYKNEI